MVTDKAQIDKRQTGPKKDDDDEELKDCHEAGDIDRVT